MSRNSACSAHYFSSFPLVTEKLSLEFSYTEGKCSFGNRCIGYFCAVGNFLGTLGLFPKPVRFMSIMYVSALAESDGSILLAVSLSCYTL